MSETIKRGVCPAGKHVVIIRSNNSIVPHSDESGGICLESDTIYPEPPLFAEPSTAPPVDPAAELRARKVSAMDWLEENSKEYYLTQGALYGKIVHCLFWRGQSFKSESLLLCVEQAYSAESKGIPL